MNQSKTTSFLCRMWAAIFLIMAVVCIFKELRPIPPLFDATCGFAFVIANWLIIWYCWRPDQITALHKNEDGSTSVVGVCLDPDEHKPELHTSWRIKDDRLNSLANMMLCSAVAQTYAITINTCVLRDLLVDSTKLLNKNHTK